MAITNSLKRIYASAPAARYVETLSFEHPDFLRTHYLHSDPDVETWNYLLEDGTQKAFTRAPFVIQLPRNDGGGRQDLQFTISNVDRIIMDELERATVNPTSPIVVTYRVYVDRAGTPPQNDPVMVLTVTQVAATLEAVSASAGRYDILNKPFPAGRYRTDVFPGLLR